MRCAAASPSTAGVPQQSECWQSRHRLAARSDWDRRLSSRCRMRTSRVGIRHTSASVSSCAAETSGRGIEKGISISNKCIKRAHESKPQAVDSPFFSIPWDFWDNLLTIYRSRGDSGIQRPPRSMGSIHIVHPHSAAKGSCKSAAAMETATDFGRRFLRRRVGPFPYPWKRGHCSRGVRSQATSAGSVCPTGPTAPAVASRPGSKTGLVVLQSLCCKKVVPHGPFDKGRHSR